MNTGSWRTKKYFRQRGFIN